jgi:hypothetical protein
LYEIGRSFKQNTLVKKIMEDKELSLLEKEKLELEELKAKVKEFEEIQRIRKEKEELKAKAKELGKKPSVWNSWGKRFANNLDDDPLGLDKFK